MKKNTKHWLFGILAVIVVGLAGLNLLAYNHAHAMMRSTTGGSRTSKPEKLTWGRRVGSNMHRMIPGLRALEEIFCHTHRSGILCV